jgi:hypothetical protein
MAEMARSNPEAMALRRTSSKPAWVDVHPAWQCLMRYCEDLGYGEIEKLKIQDGVPVIADVVREKVKFT